MKVNIFNMYILAILFIACNKSQKITYNENNSSYESQITDLENNLSLFDTNSMARRGDTYYFSTYDDSSSTLFTYNLVGDSLLFKKDHSKNFTLKQDSLFRTIYKITKLYNITSFEYYSSMSYCDARFVFTNGNKAFLLNEGKETTFFNNSDTLYYKKPWLITRGKSK